MCALTIVGREGTLGGLLPCVREECRASQLLNKGSVDLSDRWERRVRHAGRAGVE